MESAFEQLQNVPGYDIVMDKYDEYAEEHFNKIDPFSDKDGNPRRLNGTKQQQKAWRKVQKQAWVHDKCFLGLCGVGLDAGVGLVPLAVFFLPGIGPILTYAVRARLIHVAQDDMVLPAKLVAKLQANILLDFLILLPPVIGAFLSWMYSALTRNAGLIYLYMERVVEKQSTGQAPVYIGKKEPAGAPVQPARATQPRKPPRGGAGLSVGQQESGFR